MRKLITGVIIMATTITAGAGTLTKKEMAIVDLGAAVARGEQDKVSVALKSGFDAGLTLNEAKELVGQLYAYCGFPRALNAAATLMKVAEELKPDEGRTFTPFKDGYDSLKDGTANQTKLCGAPVKGALFDFHPQLDEYLKAHLFGDIFERDNLDWRTREIVTIAALAARPETAPQMKAHIAIGKNNGVTDEQASAIVRRVQMPSDPARLPADWSPIPVGESNTAYAKYFTGRSYLHKLTLDQVPAFGVTFEPGCRNNWHVHHAKTGGGQMLIVTAGEGFYQEWGKPARHLRKGDTVNIPANVKHWHGAAPDSWFQHIALEVPGSEQSNEWLEPVDDVAYAAAEKQPMMSDLLVRIAEIEVYPEHLEAYLAAGKAVGAESVAKEPGVVCIFPMQKKEQPTQIRIVEIYRDEAAYKAHLETPHFKKYKTGTLHMVKSLHLAPMQPLDKEHMSLIFRKESK